MTDVESLIAAIESEPARIDDYASDLHAILDAGETAERQAVAQTLKEATDQDPEVVARHTDLLETALRDEDETVCGAVIDAAVIISHRYQYPAPSIIDALLAALTTVQNPSSRVSAIRTLAAIGDGTEASVNDGDELFAALFENGNELVRRVVATDISPRVIEHPDAYPHMRQAYVDGLADTHPDTRLAAAQTLAAVARNDITAVPDVETVLERMKQLRNHHDIDSDTVERPIEIMQQAATGVKR